ncbi:DNA phosphorothioation-dependent restriction protein DptH [Mesobacillus campisalis]|uniref:DNA phosphorothioation-dependent restriction protein DptH n=1 Tax=Mesobacillus campisalis TaxID=1408103 RepID=A0A0M2SXB6_9BACI|nr:DNA phosphorothioation-dependent restriction protein DptH [Mesobacillus campisalis]KKK39219.1 DNA phosphorothioation-dependent restriction protein DptH [Mesobacillus campisalis]
MSNQFYNYIASLLINHFKDMKINNGDRFYLQLDSQDDVLNLVKALKGVEDTNKFTYKHELGEEYETFSIPFNQVKLVVANTSEYVKPDFLVTLRNLVGEQKREWENTALISIVSEQLDSIEGGSSNLQKEGMPLHAESLFSQLKTEIENSALGKVDQIILMDNLDNLMKEQPFQQLTFFDFEEIFTTLQKGSIDDTDYHRFGLFKDPDLTSFKGKEQKERLKENRDFFDYVRKVHELGFDKDELQKKFSPEGSNDLIGENWKDVLYPKVYKYHEDWKKQHKKKKIDLKSIKVTGKLKFWDKPHKETSAGQRKRHIIIFNPEGNERVELEASFHLEGNVKSLSSEYLNTPNTFTKKLDINVKLTNITASILAEKNKATFVRFSYKHDKKSSLGAEFYIAVLPIEPIYLDRYKSNYLVEPNSGHIELQYEEDELSFNDGLEIKKVEILEENLHVTVSEDEKLTLVPMPEAYNDNDELKINIQFSHTVVPIMLRNELPESMPITGQRIWKLIRETNKDIVWIKENNRLILENREFYFHSEYRQFFEWEAKWIEHSIKFGRFESDQLLPDEISLGEDLREAYSRFITYFKIRNSIPSLCTVTEDLRKRALEYLSEYHKEIESIKAGSPAGRKGRDLFKLGLIMSNGVLYFTPFHPIMVAYKLKLYDLLQSDEVDNSVLNRLSADSLIPFLYDERETLYKPDHQQAAMEWLTFKPVNKVSVSDSNQYLAKVVSDKIIQFKEHFSYLFMPGSQAPLQINIINIANDLEVIRGIFQWMLKEIEKVGVGIKPVEITLYKDENEESAFDLYARTETVEDFEHLFDLRLKTKDLEADDILRIIRGKLFFYKQEPASELRYAHISFYKMHAQEHHAVQPINEMISGIALDGLYSSVPSMRDDENYKTGFGTKAYSIEDQNTLAKTAYLVNELAANLRNGGNDSYRKGEAIFSRTTTADEDTLEKIFQSSYWVTFVDPAVDLEFFNKYDGNLVVIHYSDQYSSSSRYDAITVTDKSAQYYAVIQEFLKQKDIEGTESNVINTIKAFNTFNGEWLLRIIGSKGHYDREKLSIISAIKYAVSYFDHSNILWVPISLEEVLRVAGAVSLNKSEGIFTAKNLGVKGSHSDDLLLIGLEYSSDTMALYLYPVEVKIGINKEDVLEKARNQVRKTKKLIYDALTGEMGTTFTGKFYRNFFAQLFISNAKKLAQSDFWPEKNYDLTEDTIEKLLKDQYVVSNKLNKFVGDGAILSFQKNAFHRSAQLEEDVLLLNLPEKDGYEGLVIPTNEMQQWIQVKENDFIKEEMLSHLYHHKSQLVEVEPSPDDMVTGNNKEPYTTSGQPSEYTELKAQPHFGNPVGGTSTSVTNEELKKPQDPAAEQDIDYLDDSVNDTKAGTETGIEKTSEIRDEERASDNTDDKPNLEEIRIKIGKAENSNREIFWEYGNKGLANRHLLISGRSGQGKTYFMQCLLLEKSKLGIPSIVIDYTEGFLPNQLEPEFVEYLGDKLKQKIVYSEQLPINPFQKNVRDIGGLQLPESNTDVAERIKSVFAAVYKSLGIQQQNAIYEAVLRGLEKHGDTMSLISLKELLEEDGSNYAKTALSQIRPLIDRNPFRSENTINWNDIVSSNGQVYIIQLTGFPRDVQLMITEFILWDLWNYSVRYGNKNKPMPVIMDEAQNLDHTEKSPSARILTEGRKFGWSAWYATQFLKSQLDADELARLQNSSQKVYFSPPEQELSNIASSLSKDNQERKYWEQKLGSLKKGQCIVHGPVLKENGELSHNTVTIVDIVSLSERI